MSILSSLADILGADRYHPSTVALASDPVMKILFVSGWGAVFVGCTAIGLTLIFSHAQKVTVSRRAMILYAAFVILLGVDHLMSMTTVFVAVYRLKVVVLAATAAVSLMLAVLTAAQIFNIRVDPDEG